MIGLALAVHFIIKTVHKELKQRWTINNDIELYPKFIVSKII